MLIEVSVEAFARAVLYLLAAFTSDVCTLVAC